MKKASVFLTRLLLAGSFMFFGTNPVFSDGQNIKESAHRIITGFYSGGTDFSVLQKDAEKLAEDAENIKTKDDSGNAAAGFSVNEFSESHFSFEDEILVYTALSTLIPALDSDSALFFKEKIRNFEKRAKPLVSKTKDENILHLYSNYLYSKLSWEKANYGIIETLPVLYQKNALFNRSEKSLLDMALWYISASVLVSNPSSSVWNSFILSQEKFIGTLDLTETEFFNVCINYSMFYMKNLDTEKGFYYLNLAKNVFPDSMLIAIIETNYKKGKVGW